ncbi:MAG: aspartate carbamoyltransferase regulatory subunit [Candidatus Verstraetearchaeota archaeon]|nr:aspartate carbamoyltransferase regulatory subunit [Candidatus Verstraetearchaeota archaeon]
MSEPAKTKKGLIVSPIENGTVIDHLPPGKAIKIAEILSLLQPGSVVIMGQNLKSTKYGKKDLIKVEDRYLTGEEYNKIALVAPNATVNIIRNFEIQEKRKVSVPDVLEDVALCANANCISNKERIPSRLYTVSRDPLVMVCHYCNFEFKGEELRLKG